MGLISSCPLITIRSPSLWYYSASHEGVSQDPNLLDPHGDGSTSQIGPPETRRHVCAAHTARQPLDGLISPSDSQFPSPVWTSPLSCNCLFHISARMSTHPVVSSVCSEVLPNGDTIVPFSSVKSQQKHHFFRMTFLPPWSDFPETAPTNRFP